MRTKFQIEQFRNELLKWFDACRRDLPWRRTRNPYAIWVSEIMLQQTRVAAVIPYYERFLTRFPDQQTLAAAREPDLLAHWAGLGYYYRARNMQKAARQIEQVGRFPASYDEIRELPGVGDYTAAAIASIAFDLPHAVLDGNVIRVLSRVFEDRTDGGSTAGRKHFAGLAADLLDHERAGAFNQAMMELGATVCLPKSPQCLLCPVAKWCQARATGTQNELPVKKTKAKSVAERRTIFWIESEGRILVWQRPSDARLMPGFWELPEAAHLPSAKPGKTIGSFRHGITYHDYRFEILAADAPDSLGPCQWMSTSDLASAPVSTIFKKASRIMQNLRSGGRVLSTTAGA